MPVNSINKKILIIDSGMKNLGGHNYSYTRAVQSALAEKGFKTDVLTSNKLPADLAEQSGYHPTFSQGTYDFSPISSGRIDNLLYIYSQSIIFSRDIEKFLQNKLSEYAGIFSHTLADFELIAWSRFISRNKLNSQLMVLLRNTPDFSQVSFLKRKFHPFLRIEPHYLNAIHSKMKENFTLMTDCQPLTNDFEKFYKHKILTMPIPINEYFLNQLDSQNHLLEQFRKRHNIVKEQVFWVGYMGDAREVKGFYLLPKMVQKLLETNKNINFLFQCPKPSSGQDVLSFPTGVAELNEIAAKHPDRVVLVAERLNEIDYANMFRCLDLVLIPYPLPGYRKATSGVFAEAVALGKPTIVTEKTWMASELNKFGGGLELKSDNVEDLINKVIEITENYETYSEKAKNYSSQWCEFHNSHKLAEMLINEIK